MATTDQLRAAMEQRTNDAGLIVREVAVRAAGDTEDMEFTGIGVPYGEIYDTGWGYKERFAAGSVEGGESAHIYWRHREVIGRVKAGKDTAAGYELRARISNTTLGRDAWELLKDGTVDRLSIGFVPLEYTEDVESGVVTITRAEAREFSLVPNPAYKDAKISGHRHADNRKENPPVETDQAPALTTRDLEPINAALDKMERQLVTIGTAGTGPAQPEYRSMGHYLKALAAGDQEAAELHRATTSADTNTRPAFIGDFIKLVEERRRVLNAFSTGTLPATGMSVDYTQLASDTTDVAKQAAEGTDLAYGEVKLTNKNAPVDTYGGWSALTKQAIDRASTTTLNTTLRALALKYAKATNAAVSAAYKATRDAHLAAAGTEAAPGTDPDAAIIIGNELTAAAWIDAAIEAAVRFDERGFTISGSHVDKGTFKALANLTDGPGNRLMTVFGTGTNQVGFINVPGLTGNLANIKVEILTGATNPTASFYDTLAIETLESAGAPAQLQDENIINLTKQFSVYGYLATTTPFPQAILPVQFA